jgi:hypothetical protein
MPIDGKKVIWSASDNMAQAKARAAELEMPPRSMGKTAPRWRGLEGVAFVDVVEDIRYADFDARSGKPLPWKEVLSELHRQGYIIHHDADKLKADYHSAVAYWTRVFGGRRAQKI